MSYVSRARSGGLAMLLALALWGGVHAPGVAAPARWHNQPAPAIDPIQGDVLGLVNRYRASYGLSPLRLSPQLCHAAQYHSLYMAQSGQFDHYGPNGISPVDEAHMAGYAGSAIKENIAMGQQSPQQVVQDWIQSPHHRANMLSPNVTDAGIGMQNTYWTLILARP